MKTTIFKILRNEKDLVERALAEVGVPVKFFTMENTEGLLQCEIQSTKAILSSRTFVIRTTEILNTCSISLHKA
jgi:hypothetical protein